MYFFFFASTYTLFFEKNTSDVAIIIHCRRRARINRDTLYIKYAIDYRFA